MIYAITFTWEKGQALSWLSNKYIHKFGIKHIIYFDEGQKIDDWIMADLLKNGVKIEYKNDYHGGHLGYPDAMKKIAAYKKAAADFNIGDNDWLIDMDDDTIIATPKLFDLLTNNNSLIGIKHEPEFETEIGMFGHMSGACVAMRGEYLNKICGMPAEWWVDLQKEFRRQVLCEMWDVVVSYAMEKVGAKGVNMTKTLRCFTGANPELWDKLEGYFNKEDNADFFHLNETLTTFMGEPCLNSRYDIPQILKTKQLWHI